MRAFDRDLIRGGHYGQRSCEPHLKAEHTGAPTNAASVKKVLANSEPSTHGGPSCRADLLQVEAEIEPNAIHRDPNYCIAKVDHLVGACEALQSSPNYQKFS
jgi:hypothetical protein